ncbi:MULTISPECIES: hypothetical protein [unclassified Lysobacter]|uniref:hypothetical protein n=1 Tax=unclassified Lysobacter TaxID=2635362 RepID=UPI000701A239|nr:MULTISPECIES: hypothetical protein [unclassified Lysobacter]KRA20622.1 hypothetical protein ASD69_04715 [Lysobacter sp. Root604]KRD39644.1 hypothetical protein ASE35_04750 [Lysobacter sp. Root916]KRD79611.1 hypothetical protein ASE43_01515 [Lysobacter sp. Root983]
MNSKLHNSISALLVSGATLVLALVAANPALPEAPAAQVAAAAAPLPLDAAAIVRRAEAQALRIEARAQQVENLADVAALTAEVATAVALANALDKASAAEPAVDAVPHRKARKATRRNRQALVMPYFSFAPRG